MFVCFLVTSYERIMLKGVKIYHSQEKGSILTRGQNQIVNGCMFEGPFHNPQLQPHLEEIQGVCGCKVLGAIHFNVNIG